MKSILLIILLLTLKPILLFAQTGDSLTCYTNAELRKIANRVVRAKECDTLLSLCQLNLLYADSIIKAQDKIIKAKTNQLESYDLIVVGKNADIAWLQEEAFKDAKKRKWLKIGWASTSGLLGGLLIWQLLTN